MVAKRKKSSITITLLSLTFIVPIIAAWLAYSKGFLITGHTVNHGVLIEPPLSLVSLALTNEKGAPQNKLFDGKWWLLYLTADSKDAFTNRNLHYMRQIRQATGKDRDRIERGIVTMNTKQTSQFETNYPGMHKFIISEEKYQQLKGNLPKNLALEEGWLYLVDPHGNIMLVYGKNAAPKGVLKDLQRLLKVSQIG